MRAISGNRPRRFIAGRPRCNELGMASTPHRRAIICCSSQAVGPIHATASGMSVSDYSEPGLGSTAVERHGTDHTSHKDPHHDLLALLPALEQITGEFQGHHGARIAEHVGRPHMVRHTHVETGVLREDQAPNTPRSQWKTSPCVHNTLWAPSIPQWRLTLLDCSTFLKALF